MPKIKSAVQSRAIAELMSQSKQIGFMDFDQADQAMAALADEGSSVIDMIVINLKHARTWTSFEPRRSGIGLSMFTSRRL